MEACSLGSTDTLWNGQVRLDGATKYCSHFSVVLPTLVLPSGKNTPVLLESPHTVSRLILGIM